MTKIIELINLKKEYKTPKENLEVLKGINYSFEQGKIYAIKGHSGSGKTTLVRILGLMDDLTSGEYLLYNKTTKSLSDKESSYYRMKHIGFIFQEYNLNPFLKAYENVIVPMLIVPMLINKKINPQNRVPKAEELLKNVGLFERKDHYPKELSGGEQQRVAIARALSNNPDIIQRVAIARALSNNPDIIIADEPTGNLDKKNEKIIFKILKQMAESGKCVIIVSHSDEISSYADVNLILEDGLLNEVKK